MRFDKIHYSLESNLKKKKRKIIRKNENYIFLTFFRTAFTFDPYNVKYI